MDARAEQEFLDFVGESTPALFRIAHALTGQQQMAEDLLQIALERIVLRWGRVDNPAAYARKIIYHEYVRWWRRWRWRELSVAAPPEPVTATDPAAHVVLRQALHAALRQLGPRQRAVLVLRYLEDRTEAEVATILGCSVKTVASQSSRALKNLRPLFAGLADSHRPREPR